MIAKPYRKRMKPKLLEKDIRRHLRETEAIPDEEITEEQREAMISILQRMKAEAFDPTQHETQHGSA